MEAQEKKDRVTLAVVGDIMSNRDSPEAVRSIIELSVPVLKAFDLRFCQLENILSEKGTASTVGRVPARAHPRNVEALTLGGFDVVSFASNHCLDWGIEAMLDTIELVRGKGIQLFGAGKDIEDARKPVIVEKNGIRIGFLGYNSILPYGYWADVKKPGCAPLRVRTHYEMVEHDQPGSPPRILTYPYKEDMDAMLQDIQAAKTQADVVLLSLHWGLHFTRAKLATYQQEVAHAAIDAGADVIIGTHSHILKGIETYKGKAIFYSLGNFALDSGWTKSWPNLTPGQKEMLQLYNIEIDPAWARTYPHPAESRNTMVVTLTLRKGGIEKVSFLPALINIKAQARVLRRTDEEFENVVKYVEEITEEAGLNGRYARHGDEVVVLT